MTREEMLERRETLLEIASTYATAIEDTRKVIEAFQEKRREALDKANALVVLIIDAGTGQ